jgi:hypothetical protein
MITKKLFLASSSELKEDRKEFEIFIGRKNKDWVSRGGFLELFVWEDFLDAMSKTRLQDEYNKVIRQCDVFVMLFCTKVGQYTEEEFETAFGQFKATDKPLIFTYFKDVEISTGSINKKDMESVWAFKEKLDALGHFYTVYKNADELKFKFNQQLDNEKLRSELKRQESELQAIRVALRGIVTKWEIDYLRSLEKAGKWDCQWDQDTFDRLKRLDDMGFVLPAVIDGTRSFDRFRQLFQTEKPVNERPWFDMKIYWEITEDGKKYVKLYETT